ncbi:MAG: cobalamin-dependent protein [Smithellaceae bacterium]|nr:cobalamin-dependent protein [Smithellaceae bacterium]
MTDLSEQFEQALLSLDRLAAKRLVTEAADGMTSMELVDRVIVTALARIGEGWSRGETALSQVYMSGRICEGLVDELLPPGDSQRKDQPPMAIAALNDYHLLGKRIVYSTLRAGGFDLLDYGRATVDELVQRAQADQIRVLLISTLMLHSALQVRDLVLALKAASLDVKVVVGGAPFIFDPQLWREVNADAMGRSASEAVGIIQTVLGGTG